MAALTARRHGLSWTYTVFEDAREVATFRVGLLQRGWIREDGRSWTVRRPGAFARSWVFTGESGSGDGGEAMKPSPLRNLIELAAEGRQVTLRRVGLIGYRFEVDEAGEVVATIRASFMGGRIETDLPDDWPFPLCLFLLWLVPVTIRRAAATTAAGGG